MHGSTTHRGAHAGWPAKPGSDCLSAWSPMYVVFMANKHPHKLHNKLQSFLLDLGIQYIASRAQLL